MCAMVFDSRSSLLPMAGILGAGVRQFPVVIRNLHSQCRNFPVRGPVTLPITPLQRAFRLAVKRTPIPGQA